MKAASNKRRFSNRVQGNVSHRRQLLFLQRQQNQSQVNTAEAPLGQTRPSQEVSGEFASRISAKRTRNGPATN